LLDYLSKEMLDLN